MAWFTGKFGSATAKGVVWNVTGWTFTESMEAVDVSNTGSAPWQTNISGQQSGAGSVDMNWDGASGGNMPPRLTRGDYASLVLQLGDGSTVGGGGTISATVLFTEVEITSAIAGEPVSISASFTTSGAVTFA